MKDLQIQTRALSSLLGDINKGKFNFNHPLQRKSGIWNRQSMSLLIDSAIRLYPIYPALVEETEIGEYAVIDGKQRLTIFASYANNEFALSKKISPIVIDGKTYELAGKRYKKLDEAVKERFNSRELQMYIMRDATEEDIREIFARINSSKGLTNTQRRTTIENDEFRNVVYSLTSHTIFEKVLSPAQRKKDLDRDMIRQTLMLISTDKEHDYTSFRNADINNFITLYQENIDMSKIDTLKTALDNLDKNFEELKINSTSIPMIFFASYRVMKDKKSFAKLAVKIKEFIKTYDTNEEYKQYCTQGTGASCNVRGRLDYWRSIVREL